MQSSEQEVGQAINVALETGYRHIDTAFAYMNEAVIGRVLKKWLDSGKIKREELFIVTKVKVILIFIFFFILNNCTLNKQKVLCTLLKNYFILNYSFVTDVAGFSSRLSQSNTPSTSGLTWIASLS